MDSKRIEIVTDSTCDIPQDLIDTYSILVQPHVLIWGDRQYRDRVDIMPEEFYQRLSTEKTLPTTSQASSQDFANIYRKACERGAQAILAVIVSSGFSGAIQSAMQGAEGVPVPVYIHDSRGASMSMGWQVLAAARAREAGGDIHAMLAAAEKVRRCVRLIISLDTLEYVYRGGRIGNARRLLGTMLHVKPLITVDHEEAVVQPLGMAMTRRKSVDLMYKTFFDQLDREHPLHVAVLQGDAAEDAAMLMERVRKEYHPAELVSNITCPTIGIHTGPRAVALCGYAGDF